MAKISDIEIPKLLFDEAAAPATPAATNVALYAKADGLLYSKDDAGVETPLGGGAGGGGFSEGVFVKDTAGGADLTTTSTTFVDLTGATATLTTAAVRCMVNFSIMCNNSNAGASVFFDVDIDGTRFANTTNGLAYMTGTVRAIVSFSFFTNVLTAAAHTIKAQWRVSATTGGAGRQSTTTPILFQVIETTMTT